MDVISFIGLMDEISHGIFKFKEPPFICCSAPYEERVSCALDFFHFFNELIIVFDGSSDSFSDELFFMVERYEGTQWQLGIGTRSIEVQVRGVSIGYRFVRYH